MRYLIVLDYFVQCKWAFSFEQEGSQQSVKNAVSPFNLCRCLTDWMKLGRSKEIL